MSKPPATVPAAAQMTIRETRRQARVAAAGAWEAAAMRLPATLALVVALAAAGGCGSASEEGLPPAAGPPASPLLTRPAAGAISPRAARPHGAAAGTAGASLHAGRRLVVLSRRARVLTLYATAPRRRLGSAPAGLGPTHVACLDRGPCYVTDTRGDALLVFAVGDEVEPTRRYRLQGGPYAMALDRRRRRLFVTLPGRNELVELIAHGRPHVLRRWPTVRQPDAVAVDERTGHVVVTGDAAGVLEHVAP
jgi:hypothetical protein